MAYFSNSCEGDAFEAQCDKCKFGKEACPIALVQAEYNYEACNNKTARAILDALVKDNGTCTMFSKFKKDLAHNHGDTEDTRQLTIPNY